MPTTAQFTSVRVVCNNTLQIAMGDKRYAVKVPHSTTFDPETVKKALGVGVSSWEKFQYSIKSLSERKVNKFETMNYLVRVLGNPALPVNEQPNQQQLQNVLALFSGQGRGAELASASGTVWGLLNAVTEQIDHHRRARTIDYRLDSAWFGKGAEIKERAFDEAMKLVA